jgi:hypothetical protein
MLRYASAVFILMIVVGWVPSAHADPILLNFQGLQDMQAVGDFYNGGAGGNYGVSFSSNVFALKSVFSGGSGGFSLGPTGSPAIFVLGDTGSNVTASMNVSSGFTSGISFFYTAGFQETITIWSGTNGTGTVLATLSLSPNNSSCTGFPSYCNWTGVGMSFSGTAQSVTISGAANGIGLADIGLGSSSFAIPEPSSLALMGTGLLGIAIRGRRWLRPRPTRENAL